jgi:protein O-mannose beta-1,4-N-acetylglucosaminyltransferase
MGMDGGGGGKLPYSYAGAGHHQDGKLVKSFSRVEPRKFGMGLVAGFLLVTCAYFSTAKFDAIHIAMGKPRSARRIKRPPGPSAAFPSLSRRISLNVVSCLLEQSAPFPRTRLGLARWRPPPPTPPSSNLVSRQQIPGIFKYR